MRILTLALTISALLVGCGENEDISCPTFTPQPSDQYDFPVRPGTPEWVELSTGQEKIDACQIPESVLKNMTTSGLLETCLDYPLLGNMLAFTSIQYGTERQMENFNGFGELIQRQCAGKLMLERYKQMNPAYVPDGSLVEIGDYALDYLYFDMIQAQTVFLEKLTSNESRELLDQTLLKYDQFLQNQEVYGLVNAKVAALIMARIMMVVEYQSFLMEIEQNEYMEVFVSDADLQNNVETLNIILNYALDYKN